MRIEDRARNAENQRDAQHYSKLPLNQIPGKCLEARIFGLYSMLYIFSLLVSVTKDYIFPQLTTEKEPLLGTRKD